MRELGLRKYLTTYETPSTDDIVASRATRDKNQKGKLKYAPIKASAAPY